MARLEETLRTLDSRPHRRGRQFEHLCRWFLQNAPEYRPRIARVWLWDRWPGRWASDAGIDLVAETREGELWAVQAKCYDPGYQIKKADLDSFLSESSRTRFSYRLLIATTDHMGENARRTFQAQEKLAGFLLRSQLEAAEVSWPASIDDLKPALPARKAPREHQEEAVKDVCNGFKTSERGQLIMACGTGKTLVALFAAERLQSVRTLVLVPSLSLLGQTLREWAVNARRSFNYLPVCSDETVDQAEHADGFFTSVSELGFPVTSNPEEIAAFLANTNQWGVVFSTYQSSPQVAEAMTLGTPDFDLVIADEAHRCVGRVSGDFATVLNSERIRAQRRLFMTATPRYFTGRLRKEAEEADFELASMDDPKRFGPVFHRLTFGEAIARDLLSDYQVVVVGVTDSTFHGYVEQEELVTTDGKSVSNARTAAAQIALAKAMRDYDLRRVVSFHSRVRKAQDFVASVPAVMAWMPEEERPSGRVWARHVSGVMTAGERDRRLSEFRHLPPQTRGLLSNARCLAEGVDVPSIDGVAFIDPRRSQVDIIQAVGRAIRKARKKKRGTVILPVFVEETEDARSILEGSDFRPVWEVLKALRAHDEVLAEELDRLRQQMGSAESWGWRPDKIRLDVPARLGEDFVRAFNAMLVERTSASWEFWLGLLVRYVAREGDARVPIRHREDGVLLGQWVRGQRQGRRVGRLSEERAQRLASLPGWTWDQLSAEWDEAFGRVQEFVGQEGHAQVPADWVAEGGSRLGWWVSTQRKAHGDGTLSGERVRQLESLPGWTWDQLETDWEEAYTRLQEFVRREGHARVPKRYEEEGIRLGLWALRQRRFHDQGRLSSERAHRLETLQGWEWDIKEADWEAAYTHLQSFILREGHAQVPTDHVESHFSLGRWVLTQRTQFRKGKLSAKRRSHLEALSGWTWSVKEQSWKEGFTRLREFVAREGHCRIPVSHLENGVLLRSWVSNQRSAYRRNALDVGRVRKLESIPRWTWSPYEANWEEGCARMRLYIEREGHARIPKTYEEEGFPLGQWAAIQRRSLKRGKLDPERKTRLDAFPGWMWETWDETWDQGFQTLQTYIAREGHALVPVDYVEGTFSLGQWASVQRRRHSLGKLKQDRAKRLESLPGWAWRAPMGGRRSPSRGPSISSGDTGL